MGCRSEGVVRGGRRGVAGLLTQAEQEMRQAVRPNFKSVAIWMEVLTVQNIVSEKTSPALLRWKLCALVDETIAYLESLFSMN